jgi:hypothetical protein
MTNHALGQPDCGSNKNHRGQRARSCASHGFATKELQVISTMNDNMSQFCDCCTFGKIEKW